MKKISAFIVALLVAINIYGAYSGTCGDPNVNGGKNVKWTLSNGVLTISGSGAMLDYEGGATSSSGIFEWINYRSEIKSVIIKNGVTNVGSSAFVDCYSLSSIEFASSVKKIGNDAFNGCSSLKNVTFPSYLVSIGERSFQKTYINTIKLPSSIQSIGTYAFMNSSIDTVICEALTPPSIGSFPFGYWNVDILWVYDVDKYKNSDWGDLFEKIKKIGTSEDEEESVGGECGSNVNWSYKDGELTISGKGAMKDYYYYYGGNITPWKDYIRDIKSIKIQEGVTHIGIQAFYNCSNIYLTSISIPSTVKSIGDEAFCFCSNLNEVTCKASTPPTLGERVFSSIGSPKTLYVYNKSVYENSEWGQWYFTIKEINSSSSVYVISVSCDLERGKVSGGGEYEKGSVAILRATPNEGYSFLRWSDGNTDNPRYITVTKDLTLTAEFAKKITGEAYTISVSCNTEHGSVSGGGEYEKGSTAIIKATPNEGYSFLQWSDGNTDNPRNITVTNDLNLTAEFKKMPNLNQKCGDNLYWDFTDSVLTIKGTGDMYDYGAFSNAPWYKLRSSISYVVFNGEITYIGSYAFFKCTSLTSITIPNSVTKIADSTFRDCSSLTSITIPSSVTKIGDRAFDGCSNLTSVVWNAKAYYSHYSAETYGLSEEIRDQITSFVFGDEVEHIPSNLCAGMNKLTSIAIPSSVTKISSTAFSGCTSLTSIVWNAKDAYVSSSSAEAYELFEEIRDQITSFVFGNEVESIPYMLCAGMDKLTSISIPNSVTSIEKSAFSGCTSLTSIMLPYVYTIRDKAFENCSSLESVDFGNNLSIIKSKAFFNCTSLTSITIPSSVTEIGVGAFSGCTSLTSIVWNAEYVRRSRGETYRFFEEISDQITSFVFGDKVERIPDRLCAGMDKLTSITIPSSVERIDDSVFKDCTSLTSIFWNAKNASSAPFEGICGQITSFVFGDEVERIPDSLCVGMDKLTSITIPNSVTYTGDYAFSKCSSLTSITIPNSVTVVGFGLFSGCTSLTSVILPEGIKIIFNDVFLNCISLTSITIPSSVERFWITPFSGCISLTTIICQAKEVPLLSSSFEGISISDITLYVPEESLELYKTAYVWKDFGTILPIPETDIEDVFAPNVADKTTKIFYKGQIYIIRDGKTYTIMGQEVNIPL